MTLLKSLVVFFLALPTENLWFGGGGPLATETLAYGVVSVGSYQRIDVMLFFS